MVSPIEVGETYKGHRRPGLRLTDPLVESLAPHKSTAIAPLLYAVHAFDKAHVVMLSERGILPMDVGRTILGNLLTLEAEGIEKFRLESGGGVHSAEYALMPLLGESVAGHINLARSSMDLGRVSLRIYYRDQILSLVDVLNQLRRVFYEISILQRGVVMPMYTQNQHGQVTSLSHVLLAWEQSLMRDVKRAWAEFDNLQVSPAGAAASTGSSFDVDMSRTADLLGFRSASINTFDAVMHHDVEIAVASLVSAVGYNLSRICDDLLLYSSSEYSMVEFPDRFCGTSSIMMQKKNAYAPQHIKGIASAAVGALVTAMSVGRGNSGLSSADWKYADSQVVSLLVKQQEGIRWMIDFMPELTWNTSRMQENAALNWACATDLAALMVQERGLSWRSAHQVVGIVVRVAMEAGTSPGELSSEDVDRAAVEYLGTSLGLDAEMIREALDPVGFVERRAHAGGPASSAIEQAREVYLAGIVRDEERVIEEREWIAAAGVRLSDAVSQLLDTADEQGQLR